MIVSILVFYLLRRNLIFKTTMLSNESETSQIKATTKASFIDCLLNFIIHPLQMVIAKGSAVKFSIK